MQSYVGILHVDTHGLTMGHMYINSTLYGLCMTDIDIYFAQIKQHLLSSFSHSKQRYIGQTIQWQLWSSHGRLGHILARSNSGIYDLHIVNWDIYWPDQTVASMVFTWQTETYIGQTYTVPSMVYCADLYSAIYGLLARLIQCHLWSIGQTYTVPSMVYWADLYSVIYGLLGRLYTVSSMDFTWQTRTYIGETRQLSLGFTQQTEIHEST